jgi:hypothetical protein
MNHQAIIDQLSALAPQLKASDSPESVLVKYASDRNLSAAQLERIGQVYNIAKTLNFMDKSANRGDSFKVLDNAKMLADYTKHTPKSEKKEANAAWGDWFDSGNAKAASEKNYDDITSWFDVPEKVAKIVKEDDQFTVYSGDGTKRLSKPGTKEEAVKRLKQVEYFKHHKDANTVPNIMAMTQEESYSPVTNDSTPSLPGTGFAQIKDELRKESYYKFELESTSQIIDDTTEDIRKIANELLEMHRLSPLPFAEMERDAFYCAADSASIKVASDAVADYFKQKGWELERHDYTTPAPRLARDKYNVLPLFKSAADNIELYKSSILYKEDLIEKKSTLTEPTRKVGPANNNTFTGGSWLPPFQPRPGPPGQPAAKVTGKDDKPAPDKGKDIDPKEIVNAIKQLYSPKTYAESINDIPNVIKELGPTSNKRQQRVDIAGKDVSRVATLQRLLLSDPIIGEADPDTVVSLYNTLAAANPEIAGDANLLRFALREALQYDAVPLHTYKDLISMGKDRADTEVKQNELTSKRYSI